MNKRLLEYMNQSMFDQEISQTFKRIVTTLCSSLQNNEFHEPYSPSLAECKYLVDHIIKQHNHEFIRLTPITLTVRTGSYLANLLNNTQIKKILFGNVSNGEVSLMRHVEKKMEYKFSCRISFDRIESLTYALNKPFGSLDFSDSNITVDDFRMILRILIDIMKESKTFNYDLKWNQSFNINQLGLDELLDFAKRPQLIVHNNHYDGTRIKISGAGSSLSIYFDYRKINTNDIKQFLNQNSNNNCSVQVNEHERDCLLLISMINIFKKLPPMPFKINCSTEEFFGREKLNEIVKGVAETLSLTALKLSISDLTSEDLEVIVDEIKNMKLHRLELLAMDEINLIFKTVGGPFRLLGIPCLRIDDCDLNYEITEKLACQLKHNKLEKLSITLTDLSDTLDGIVFMLLNGSDLTNVELRRCELSCENVQMIVESLKNTKITSLDLTGNSIEDAEVKAVANVVAQTKLNTLILDEIVIGSDSVIELLKSIQTTKITTCSINSIRYTYDGYEAIANILKDNQILLEFIPSGWNDNIDEYLKRNNNSLVNAELIIDKYQEDTILYHYEYKIYFEAFESFADTDILWTDIKDKQLIKLKLKNKINDNYFKICGIINEKLEVNNKNLGNEKNISDLSTEIINMVCSNLNLSDVIS